MGGVVSLSGPNVLAYEASYAPTDRATCKGCRAKIAKGALRLSRELPNEWTGDRGRATAHYHFACGAVSLERAGCGPKSARDRDHAVAFSPAMSVRSDVSKRDAAKARGRFAAAERKWRARCA